MTNPFDDVKRFHEVTETPVLTRPQFPSDERLALRIDLTREEVVQELMNAIYERDLVGTFDGIIDSIYTLIGLAHECGLPLEAGWNEVQRSNLAKAVLQPDGTYRVRRRADGKILKPEGWKPPDLESILRAHGFDPDLLDRSR